MNIQITNIPTAINRTIFCGFYTVNTDHLNFNSFSILHLTKGTFFSYHCFLNKQHTICIITKKLKTYSHK